MTGFNSDIDFGSDIAELARVANRAFNALSPAEQRRHRREQAISFAYGNTKLHNRDVTMEMCERAWIAKHPCPLPPEGWVCTRGADHGGPCAAEPSEKGLDAALVFLRRQDGGILTVWNRKHRCWGLPGGKREPEESLQQTARREMREETGVGWHFSNNEKPIDVSPTFSGSGRMCHVFMCGDCSDLRQAYAGELLGGVGWMTKEFLLAEPTTGEWFKGFFERTGL